MGTDSITFELLGGKKLKVYCYDSRANDNREYEYITEATIDRFNRLALKRESSMDVAPNGIAVHIW